VVAATNQILSSQERRKIPQDLYHRLSQFQLRVLLCASVWKM